MQCNFSISTSSLKSVSGLAMIEQIQWLGHGSFLIQSDPIIYVNPWRVIRTAFLADVILVTHDHYDHCSVGDVEKLKGPNTQIIGNARVAEQIDGVRILRPWHSMTLGKASIKAVPAYSPEDVRHPESDGGLGFVISTNFYDIYYAGDTKRIKEMELIHPDIAILPIDNDGTLSVDEAVDVVKLLRPRWVFPSNWGARGEGVTRVEAEDFKRKVGGNAEVILP
jgi:L-ascorbate metabolism protein UlaG (beta-lactamase superfamily)